ATFLGETSIMTQTSLSPVVRHIRKLAGADAVRELSDTELLERFVAVREERAFAALLRRHGPLVWSVCWQVLHHRQDAEDAFQATFLLLARQGGAAPPARAGPPPPCLGGFRGAPPHGGATAPHRAPRRKHHTHDANTP